MAALNTAAIQTSIVNVMTGAFIGLRSLATGRFQDSIDGANKALALAVPTFNVEVDGVDVHSASPLSNSASLSIETVDLTITLSYTLPPNMMVADRYAAQATITNDANLVRQALTMPGNLVNNGAGTPVPTGIVSGLLTGPSGAAQPSISFARDWEAQTATTTIQAAAVVVVDQLIA